MTTATKISALKTNSSTTDKITILRDKILDAVESGTPPWKAPYLAGGLALSMSTRKPYRGINPFLLVMAAQEKGYTSRWWGTYDKIGELSGLTKTTVVDAEGKTRKAWVDKDGSVKSPIRKDEKATMVTFFSRIERKQEDKKTGKEETKVFGFWRTYNVFNAEQADHLPEQYMKAPDRNEDFDPLAEADGIVLGYTTNGGPTIEHRDQAMAWYAPATDVVNVPSPENIRGTNEYYSTMFHELAHSTGHKSRIDREGVNGLGVHKRGAVYAAEELIAEFTAAFLCGQTGIIDSTLENSAAYIKGWSKFIKDDPKALMTAASAASKAMDRILGITYTDKETA